MDSREIKRRFQYHRADPDMTNRFKEVRDQYENLAHGVLGPLPDSNPQEVEQAATHLDESLRWVFAAMIRPAAISNDVEQVPDAL